MLLAGDNYMNNAVCDMMSEDNENHYIKLTYGGAKTEEENILILLRLKMQMV